MKDYRKLKKTMQKKRKLQKTKEDNEKPENLIENPRIPMSRRQ